MVTDTIENELALDPELLSGEKGAASTVELVTATKNLDLEKEGLGKEMAMNERVDSTKVEVLVLWNHKTNNRMLILCRKGLF